MKKIIIILSFAAAVIGIAAHAEPSAPETWSVEGKIFTTKAQAIRFIVASGKRLNVTHSRCEILTNKLAFKACPKDKASSFENEQFQGLKVN